MIDILLARRHVFDLWLFFFVLARNLEACNRANARTFFDDYTFSGVCFSSESTDLEL